MSSVFKADKDVVALVQSVRDEHHPHLRGIEPTVLFAQARISDRTGEPCGPALRTHGSAALATIKICNPQQRALTGKDVLIMIDCSEWDKMSPEQRLALIDHQWSHIEVIRDARGRAMVGSNGQARLNIKRHDWQIGGFNNVIARHGDASVEMMQINSVLQDGSPVKTKLRQMSLWG